MRGQPLTTISPYPEPHHRHRANVTTSRDQARLSFASYATRAPSSHLVPGWPLCTCVLAALTSNDDHAYREHRVT